MQMLGTKPTHNNVTNLTLKLDSLTRCSTPIENLTDALKTTNSNSSVTVP